MTRLDWLTNLAESANKRGDSVVTITTNDLLSLVAVADVYDVADYGSRRADAHLQAAAEEAVPGRDLVCPHCGTIFVNASKLWFNSRVDEIVAECPKCLKTYLAEMLNVFQVKVTLCDDSE